MGRRVQNMVTFQPFDFEKFAKVSNKKFKLRAFSGFTAKLYGTSSIRRG